MKTESAQLLWQRDNDTKKGQSHYSGNSCKLIVWVRGATCFSFWGGTIFMNFYSMTSSYLFNRGKIFRKRSQIKFSLQHFRKQELFCFNQARN